MCTCVHIDVYMCTHRCVHVYSNMEHPEFCLLRARAITRSKKVKSGGTNSKIRMSGGGYKFLKN